MKISVNLATRPYADQGPALKRLRIGMGVLALVLCLLGLGMLHFHQAALKMQAQEDAVKASIAKIQHEQLGYEAQMQQPANARVLQQAEFLNKLFDEKSFSWTAAMEDLERVLPGGVQVTAIEPMRSKEGRITLHLRVSGQRERSVSMLRNMEKSQRFSSPRISGENAENTAGGNSLQVQDSGRVSFDVLAEYNPATLEERKAEIASSKRMHGAAVLPKNSLPLRPLPRTPTPQAVRPAYIPPNAVQPMAGQPMPGQSPSAMRSRGGPAMPMNIPGQAGPPIPNPHPNQDSGGPQ
jgi:type IV pilus assembly protein PilN